MYFVWRYSNNLYAYWVIMIMKYIFNAHVEVHESFSIEVVLDMFYEYELVVECWLQTMCSTQCWCILAQSRYAVILLFMRISHLDEEPTKYLWRFLSSIYDCEYRVTLVIIELETWNMETLLCDLWTWLFPAVTIVKIFSSFSEAVRATCKCSN